MMRTLAALAVLGWTSSFASAVTVTAPDSTGPWIAFMNVSELPANGGGFVFASGWGVPDVNSSFDDGAGTLTLSPNTIGDPNEFWYQNTTGMAADPTNPGGPGQAGNKFMEANLFIESQDGSLLGQTVTFEGEVLSDTYTSAHTVSAFIREFTPSFALVDQTITPITTGAFSIDLVTTSTAGNIVQYGFQNAGENVWVTDTAPFGSVVLATTNPIPEPATAGLVGLLMASGLAFARRR